MATNYSIYAIPAAYILSFLPHCYANFLIILTNDGRWDNSNPRSAKWLAVVQKAVPPKVFARFERAEAAHRNGQENITLFASAIILGNMAKLPVGRLNSFAALHFAFRVVFTLAYMYTENKRLSYFRTGIWLVSTTQLLWEMVVAGNRLRLGYW